VQHSTFPTIIVWNLQKIMCFYWKKINILLGISIETRPETKTDSNKHARRTSRKCNDDGAIAAHGFPVAWEGPASIPRLFSSRALHKPPPRGYGHPPTKPLWTVRVVRRRPSGIKRTRNKNLLTCPFPRCCPPRAVAG